VRFLRAVNDSLMYPFLERFTLELQLEPGFQPEKPGLAVTVYAQSEGKPL
jgi:hypothetical protein